jgi:hypothetical protein
MPDLFGNKDRQLIVKSTSQSTELAEPLTRLYNSNPIRTAKNKKGEEVWVVIDVMAAMGYKNPKHYWVVTKKRMIDEGCEWVTNCDILKIKAADGKYYDTLVMTIPQILRLLQSLPSKKAEPFRQYMAEAGYIIAKEAQNPDLAIQRGMERYRAMGMTEEQAKLRIRSVIHRKELTDKWASHGISAPREFALLTDRESKGVFGKTTGEMKHDRNLPAYGNLRDKMTKPELTAQDVADVAISLLIDKHNPYGYTANCTEVDKGSALGARLLADLQRTLED